MAMVNRKWASGMGEDGNPVYAPAGTITVNGHKVYNPTDKHYRLAGFLPVVDEPPSQTPALGWHYEPRGWEEQDGAIRRVYAEVLDPPPPPKTYSKYRLVLALQNEGVWERVKAWLESIEGAYDLYQAAEDISGDEPLLAAGVEAAKEAFGWTDEQVAEILAQAEVG